MQAFIYITLLGLVVALVCFIPALFAVGGWLALKIAAYGFLMVMGAWAGLATYDWIMSMFNRPAATN